MSEICEIIKINDREYVVSKNRTVLTDQNIIHVIVEGEQTDAIARAQKIVNKQLFELVDGQTCFLIDLNKSGKNSPEARSTWNELSAHDKLKKAAVFGLNPVVRVIASFVIGFSVKKNQRFFKTEEEARAWLME